MLLKSQPILRPVNREECMMTGFYRQSTCLAGRKIASCFPHLFFCVSTLIVCTITASYIVELAEQQKVGKQGRDNSIKKFGIQPPNIFSLYVYYGKRCLQRGCILNCFMLSSLPTFCYSAIPTSQLVYTYRADLLATVGTYTYGCTYLKQSILCMWRRHT